MAILVLKLALSFAVPNESWQVCNGSKISSKPWNSKAIFMHTDSSTVRSTLQVKTQNNQTVILFVRISQQSDMGALQGIKELESLLGIVAASKGTYRSIPLLPIQWCNLA
ncbi:hypothetical protein BDP27DRAFT_916812 [Rhodocollybia butyracea]|uniref:Uncharacterized protein n=1 Tax=Rhodocollybia butyracea TaxID=206335 RepID=A0A9P5TUX3_9AGAR|nr:hypothetical protein BDP27DRAFT_916812 [Rhodocollybia butyracea]